jgi:hypothetical protein
VLINYDTLLIRVHAGMNMAQYSNLSGLIRYRCDYATIEPVIILTSNDRRNASAKLFLVDLSRWMVEWIPGLAGQGCLTGVGAELAIHGGDLRHRWTVAVGHDRRSWRYHCCI